MTVGVGGGDTTRHREAVAEAIAAANRPSYSWYRCSAETKQRFRRMADAAIQALGLTPEYSTAFEKQGDGGVWRDERTASLPLSIAEANVRIQQKQAVGWMRNARVEARWVGPWTNHQEDQ